MESVFLSLAVCILSAVCITLTRKVIALTNRVNTIEEEIRKELTVKWASKLKTTAPPEIIVESESAFQRYQRGKLG